MHGNEEAGKVDFERFMAGELPGHVIELPPMCRTTRLTIAGLKGNRLLSTARNGKPAPRPNWNDCSAVRVSAEEKAAMMPDVNTGKKWSAMDLEDLRNSLRVGTPIEQIAEFMMRDVEEVREKIKELDLLDDKPSRND